MNPDELLDKTDSFRYTQNFLAVLLAQPTLQDMIIQKSYHSKKFRYRILNKTIVLGSEKLFSELMLYTKIKQDICV